MKIKMLWLAIAFIATSFTLPIERTYTFEIPAVQSTVYVCMGKYAKRYHFSSNCRGLNNCKADIYSVSLERAYELGRTKCQLE